MLIVDLISHSPKTIYNITNKEVKNTHIHTHEYIHANIQLDNKTVVR